MKLQLSERAQNVFGIAVVVMILGTFATFLFWPEDDHYPPIIDVQMHYHRDAWHTFSPRSVIGVMKELNIPMAVVSSAPNEGTFRLLDEGFLSVAPSLTPYNSIEDRREWFADESVIDRLRKHLASGRFRGIGEVHIRDGQVRGPVVEYLFNEAVKRDMVLLTHSDVNALRQIYRMKPQLRIIWAHAGMTAKTYTIEGMLIKHPNLYVEMSHRTDILKDGTLKPEWRKLFLRYPKRFMVGSGTYNNSYWYEYRYMIGRIRKWLNQLPPEVAEEIGYRNAKRLYSRGL